MTLEPAEHVAHAGTDARLTVLPQEWSRAKPVLTEALKLTSDDRIRFIEEAFPNEPRLLDELLIILDNYRKATGASEMAWTGGTTFGTLVPSPDRAVQGPNKPLLTQGDSYGPYRVLRKLGEGGMGQVFLAEDKRLGRRVAVKSLTQRWLQSPVARQRLMREARTAAALTHANIATLYDVFEDGEHLLLVMEYVEGRPLSTVLAEAPIPLGHALRLAIQMTDAVGYAHDRGIIHCDIKPANVQLALDGTAKVLDFGLARARFAPDDELSVSERGTLLGTPGYMAPERLLRGTLNASGDIYGLGVVLFELIARRHPFNEIGPALLLAVLGGPAPRPSSVATGVPAALDEVVERALARDPTLRYHSALELNRDLSDVLASIEGRAPASSGQLRLAEQPRAAAAAWQDRLLAGAAVAAAVVVVLTLAGFVTSTIYNVNLGRTEGFEGESPLVWPYWGLRSLVGPAIYMGLASVGFMLLTNVCRLALTMIGPLGRLCDPLMAVARRGSESVRSTPAAVLAPALLLAQVVALGLLLWRFREIVRGLDSFISQRPSADLAPLGPSNRPEQNLALKVLWLQVLVYGVAWYWLVRRRWERRERDAVALEVGGIALTALILFFGQVVPFRIVYHNDAERVSYETRMCYLVGERGNEGLLFCPERPPPWNQIVKLDDAALKRERIFENIFAGVDSNNPSHARSPGSQR